MCPVFPNVLKLRLLVRDMYLVKTEKALHLWLEDVNRKRSQVDNNVLQQKIKLCHRRV